MKLAIIGRPNVGKSSLLNALTKSERVIVTPIPGTTRDAVDVPFAVETDGVRQSYVLIDTPGVRKTRRIADSIEFFSVKRAEDSIARCDIVVLVLDAEAGITEQDKKIGDLIVENHKACIVVVNKWDLVEQAVRQAREEEIVRRRRKERREASKMMTTLGEFGQWVQEHLFFLDYAPVIFTSAKSGFHLDRLLEAVRYVAAQLKQTVPTAILNRALRDAVERRQPISAAGHRSKFFYATQTKQAPPTFLLFVNRDELFRSLTKDISRASCAGPSATRAARLSWSPNRAPRPWNPCENSRAAMPATGRRSAGLTNTVEALKRWTGKPNVAVQPSEVPAK